MPKVDGSELQITDNSGRFYINPPDAVPRLIPVQFSQDEYSRANFPGAIFPGGIFPGGIYVMIPSISFKYKVIFTPMYFQLPKNP